MYRILALVDHDNIPWHIVSASRLVTQLARALVELESGVQIDVHFRSYGGWDEDGAASPSRTAALALYQQDLPSILIENGAVVRVNLEFADGLLEPRGIVFPRIRVARTYVTRSSAQTATRVNSAPAQCESPLCELRRVRKWIGRKRACTAKNCSLQFSEAWARREQKQVDTHIASDLLFARTSTHDYDALVVVSDDVDFLPCLATATRLKGRQIVGCMRFLVPVTYMDADLRSQNVVIVAYTSS